MNHRALNFFVFFAFTLTTIVLPAHADPMPENLAKAVLDDERTVKMVNFLENSFNAECKIPQPDRVNADIECFGKGYTGSCFYSFDILCPGDKNLSRLSIRSEFINIAPAPLNMEITVRFQK